MYTINTSSIFHFIQTLWELAAGALRLDPAAFVAMASPGTGLLAATILFLAGVSETLGQSVVLLANRVKPGRFVLSLLINGLLFIVSAFIWVSTIWAIARLVYRVNDPYLEVLKAVSLAYAPVLFSFLTLLPYMGTFINRALSVWSFLAVLVALRATMGLDLTQSLVCALFGFIFLLALKVTIGRPFVTLERWIRRAIAGVSSTVEVKDLVETITEQIAENPKGGKS